MKRPLRRWAALRRRAATSIAVALLGAIYVAPAGAVDAPSNESRRLALYVVEIRTGPAWDAARPATDQPHFREHSANLRRLRDAGSLVIGGRYADKGLLVLQAADEPEAHAMMKADPSIAAGVFAYHLHPFSVFYGGTLSPRKRD